MYDVDLPFMAVGDTVREHHAQSHGKHAYSRLAAPPTGQPYRVRTIGRIHGDPRHSTLGTYFDDAMLLIFLSGKGIYHLGEVDTPVRQGMVGIILPQGDPGLLICDPVNPYDHLQCRFAGKQAIEVATRIANDHGGRRLFEHPRWQELAEILQRGLPLWPGRELGPPPEQEKLRRVDAILAEALACLDVSMVQTAKRHAAQLHEYMHVHIGRPINLDVVAADFAVSKQYLCRMARKELGQTLGNAWIDIKLRWARILLQREAGSIADVARRVGFDDPLYFSRVFKRHVGISPAAWRRRSIQTSQAK